VVAEDIEVAVPGLSLDADGEPSVEATESGGAPAT